MRHTNDTIPALLLLLLFMGCREIVLPPEPDNLQPEGFEIEVVEVKRNSAVIQWEPSRDPDGDAIQYEIYMRYSHVHTAEEEGFYTFEGLEMETVYWGRVFAVDGNGGATVSTFNFTTTQ